MHRRMHHNLIRDRERNSSFWRSCVSHWCTAGHSYVLPAYGFHVAIRQLEPPAEGHQMAADGSLECVRHCHRYIPYGWRHVWQCCGDYERLQGIWRVGSMDLRGQLEFGSCWLGVLTLKSWHYLKSRTRCGIFTRVEYAGSLKSCRFVSTTLFVWLCLSMISLPW